MPACPVGLMGNPGIIWEEYEWEEHEKKDSVCF